MGPVVETTDEALARFKFSAPIQIRVRSPTTTTEILRQSSPTTTSILYNLYDTLLTIDMPDIHSDDTREINFRSRLRKIKTFSVADSQTSQIHYTVSINDEWRGRKMGFKPSCTPINTLVCCIMLCYDY